MARRHVRRSSRMAGVADKAFNGNTPPPSRGAIPSGSCISWLPSLLEGRRESRAPAAPVTHRVRGVAKWSAHGFDRYSQGHPGFPRAMALRLMSRSPRGTASFAPVAGGETLRRRSARVAAPGPHDFAVRRARARPVIRDHLTQSLRPSQPAPTSRDDRAASPFRGRGMAGHILLNYVNVKHDFRFYE